MTHPDRCVCVLTSTHSITDARVVRKEARSLASAGFNIDLVLPTLNSRAVDSIRIIAVAPPRSRLERLTITPWRVFWAAIRGSSARIFHLHDPELWLVAVILRLTRKVVVYDVHENVPATFLERSWVPRLFRQVLSRLFGFLEARVANCVTAVVAADDEIAKRFAKHNRNVVTVRNLPLLEEFDDLAVAGEAERDPSRSDYVCCFAGVDRARVTDVMVEAIHLICKKEVVGQLKLVLAGKVESKEYLEFCSKQEGWRYVDFLGYVAREQMIPVLKRGLAALVLYTPHPNHLDVRSNRLYESMAAGLPVLVPNFPNWKRIVDEYQCGIAVDPMDPKAVSSALEHLVLHRSLAAQMGRNGREAILSSLNWTSEEKALVGLYADLSSRTPIGFGSS